MPTLRETQKANPSGWVVSVARWVRAASCKASRIEAPGPRGGASCGVAPHPEHATSCPPHPHHVAHQEKNPPTSRALCVYGGRVFLWVLPYMGRGRVGELGVCFLMSLLMSLHQRCGTLWRAGFGLPPLSPPSLGEGTMLCGLRAWLFTRD